MKASKILIKVFSATMEKGRNLLGEQVSEWLARNGDLNVTEIRTLQSSDNAFHCVTIIVFAEEP